MQKKNKEIERAREKLAINGLLGSGLEGKIIVPILKKYEDLNALVDEKDALSEISRDKISLFKNSLRHRPYYRMEQLFRNVQVATYPRIAIFIGLLTKSQQFNLQDKKRLLKMKETFNKKSRKKWGEILKATRNKAQDGLQLVPVK